MKFSRLIVLVLSVLILTPVYGHAYAPPDVALGSDAKANSVYPGLGADKAVDGDHEVHWSSSGFASPSSPIWLAVDLGNAYSLSHVDLYSHYAEPGNPYYGYGINYNLYYSTNVDSWNNDTAWTKKADGTLNTDLNNYFNVIDFGGTNAQYLKFEVVGGNHWAHLYELEAYGDKATVTPEPASMLLFGVGTGAMALLRKKRSKNS